MEKERGVGGEVDKERVTWSLGDMGSFLHLKSTIVNPCSKIRN